MRYRELAIRAVLVAGILTTIATSAPPSHKVEDVQSASVDAAGVTTVNVEFSAAAVEQSYGLLILFAARSGPPVMLIPDDPAQPAVALSGTFSIDATELCPPVGSCALGFSLDVGETSGQAIVTVTAEASRGGDASFCLPDNDPFSPDATVEIAITPPTPATGAAE